MKNKKWLMIDKKRLDNAKLKVKEIWNDDKEEKNGKCETKREWGREQQMILITTASQEEQSYRHRRVELTSYSISLGTIF